MRSGLGASGESDKLNNPLKHAPHTAAVATAMGAVIVRMLLAKAGFIRRAPREQKMSQLRKELDLLLWAPPVLIALCAIYAVGAKLLRGN